MLANKQHGFSGLYLLIAVVLLGFSSCKKNSETLPEKESYSFFIAGHSYGYPGVDNPGLHPPFMEKFNLINSKKAAFGFLLGDIVNTGTVKNWDEVDSVLLILDSNVYFVAGNHDMTDRPLFESRYGITYFSFIFKDDLFIVLDPNIDQWNISGDQLTFLKTVLKNENEQVDNIFVLSHQLLWWSKNNKYKHVRINSNEGRADSINFFTEVEPLFRSLQIPVFLFAGDLGAGHWCDNVMYDRYDNMTLIASGMGEGVGDNFIFVNVNKFGEVSFELIALNEDDIHSMGNVEDYDVDGSAFKNRPNTGNKPYIFAD